MSTEEGIKQGVAAARSLLHHLEQGQARWLARLANPSRPALAPDQTPAVRLLEALGAFDPMDGIADLLPEHGTTDSPEPLGIGARPRDTIRRPQDRRPAGGLAATPTRRRPEATDTVAGATRRKVVEAGLPAGPNRSTHESLEPEPAVESARRAESDVEAGAHERPERRNRASPNPSPHGGKKLEPGSDTQAHSIVRQLADARRVLAGKLRDGKVGLKRKPRNANLSGPRERSPRPVTSAPSLGSRSRPAPDAPDAPDAAVAAVAPVAPDTPGGARAESNAPLATSNDRPASSPRPLPAADRAQPGPPFSARPDRTSGPTPTTESIPDPNIARPADPAPARPPRPRDDPAQQLADAARRHGIDLT
jgi:hypothetical protein